MSIKYFSAFLAGALALGASAYAHPGPKLLTAGKSDAQTAMTPGMTYEDVKGVHLFRGAKHQPELKHMKLLGGRKEIRIEIAAPERSWRSIRRMRTQGFYSGAAPKSHRYTQGFYSGD